MKLKAGDIFSIPIDVNRFGIGQIVKIPNKESLSVILYKEIFDNLYDKDIEEKISEYTPIFFGNTFDAKFHHNHWVIIGNNVSNLPTIKLPYYKIGSFPTYVENFDEKRIRRASNEDLKLLTYRKYVAPIRLENALLAYHKLEEWKNDLFDPLLYSYNLQSSELIEKGK